MECRLTCCAPQIRRDPKISWITAPVHKRREARGLTSIGKQVRRSRCYVYLHHNVLIVRLNVRRTVVSARAAATTTRHGCPPGKSTTPSASVATGERVVCAYSSCRFLVCSYYPCFPCSLCVYVHPASCHKTSIAYCINSSERECLAAPSILRPPSERVFRVVTR